MSEHDHGHGPGGHRTATAWRLAIVLGLVACYMAAEVVGGLLTGSLALLADAGHMFSDAAALALSLFAVWIARRPPTSKLTYGYYRAEILAALVNGATLVAVSLYIFVEAYERIAEPPEVEAGLMLAIAAGGLAVNVAGLWLLHAGQAESLNIRAAWLHLLSDLLGSVAVIVGGILILAFEWHWADPLISVLIGLLVIHSAWALLKEAIAVLMEGTPGHLDLDEVRSAVAAVPHVVGIHDLHVWTITSGLVSLSCHVVCDDTASSQMVLAQVKKMLHDRFEIQHSTIQIEPADFEEHRTAICEPSSDPDGC